MATTLDMPLLAYPTLTGAADMLGISGSTLSRRRDLAAEKMGERDRRIPASEIMRLAALYRKRSLNEVAADLIDYAQRHAPDQVEAVEDQVQRFFETRHTPLPSGSAFLKEAKRALPEHLYLEVERIYRMPGSDGTPALISAD